MKNKKLIVTALVIVLTVFTFSLGFLSGKSQKVVTQNLTGESPKKETGKEPIKNNNTNSNDKQEVKVASSNENDLKDKLYGLKEFGNYRDLGIQIIDWSETQNIDNKAGSISCDSNSKFIVLKLELKNNANEPIKITDNIFTLVLENESDINSPLIYAIDDVAFKGMQTLNNFEAVYNENTSHLRIHETIPSGLTKSFFITFNVPNSTQLTHAADLLCIGDADDTNDADNVIAFMLKK